MSPKLYIQSSKDSPTQQRPKHLFDIVDTADSVDTPQPGEVWLVGAGPGHPMLMTRYAWHALHNCDVIVHDALIDPRLINALPCGVERIFVGKRSGGKERSSTQEDISALLVSLAQKNLAVVRLKGGDPLVFGRGGEEIFCLAKNSIPFRVIPGITAANGAMSWLGIPLTERTINHTVTLVSASSARAESSSSVSHLHDWEALARAPVLVFYMARQKLQAICYQLILHGREKQEPALVLASITTDDQKVYQCTLEDAHRVEVDSKNAVLFVVGSVCDFYRSPHKP